LQSGIVVLVFQSEGAIRAGRQTRNRAPHTDSAKHANDDGTLHLYRVPLDGRSPAVLLEEYSLDPAWAPGGGFIVYSGPDIGTRFSVKAITPEAVVHPLPELTLPRGDISADGSEAILEREQERSSVVMMDLPQR